MASIDLAKVSENIVLLKDLLEHVSLVVASILNEITPLHLELTHYVAQRQKLIDVTIMKQDAITNLLVD